MTAYFGQFFGRELYFRSTNIFLDALNAFRAGNGNNPRLSRQQPPDGYTRRGSSFLLGKLFHIFHQFHVMLQIPTLETGNYRTENGNRSCQT